MRPDPNKLQRSQCLIIRSFVRLVPRLRSLLIFLSETERDFSAELSRSRDVGSFPSEILRFRCKMEDMGGRHGLTIRRWGFLGRPAYELSSSSPLVFASRGICEKFA
ncbi:unnamed protein product [Prunus armeniaca]|uniref:Uncharacterized protein n=1 Tax=Prunus armeniaca TaxID=36596 RepID=A0A6J5XXE8_PRUAR|nr:hypothetical protein GBA52_018753 [Prunus armeniaca]KAH0994891.1 hypothetical protein GBA52_018755 [Prunus armeniaca]CAB4315684.1 unnamed protein product [Prunus armeniaca]